MKCLQMYPGSNIIIAEDMSVFEVYQKELYHKSGIYFIRKLPMKANINFNKWYGDDGKCNWYYDHLPIEPTDDKDIWEWDY